MRAAPVVNYQYSIHGDAAGDDPLAPAFVAPFDVQALYLP